MNQKITTNNLEDSEDITSCNVKKLKSLPYSHVGKVFYTLLINIYATFDQQKSNACGNM